MVGEPPFIRTEAVSRTVRRHGPSRAPSEPSARGRHPTCECALFHNVSFGESARTTLCRLLLSYRTGVPPLQTSQNGAPSVGGIAAGSKLFTILRSTHREDRILPEPGKANWEVLDAKGASV